MNKNGHSYSSAIEGHRKRARYTRLLYTQKGRVDTRGESGKISRKTSNIFDDSIPNDPTPVLQPTPWRSSNVTTKDMQNIKMSLLRACRSYQILVNVC